MRWKTGVNSSWMLRLAAVGQDPAVLASLSEYGTEARVRLGLGDGSRFEPSFPPAYRSSPRRLDRLEDDPTSAVVEKVSALRRRVPRRHHVHAMPHAPRSGCRATSRCITGALMIVCYSE